MQTTVLLRPSWPEKPRRFHNALESKDGNEQLVDEVEDLRQLLRLVVMFHRHCRHVQQDDDHYDDVEILVRRQLEEE